MPAARLAKDSTFYVLVENIISHRREVLAVFNLSIHHLNITTMKEFMNIWIEPFKTKELDRTEKFVLGIVAPAAFMAVVILSHLLP